MHPHSPTLPDRLYRITGTGTAEEKCQRYWRSFRTIVARPERVGRQVIVIAPVPEIARPIDKYILHGDPAEQRLPTVPRACHDARNSWVKARLAGLGVRVLDPAQQLCDARQYYGTETGVALYFDDDRLSLDGARHVVAPLLEARPRRVRLELPSPYQSSSSPMVQREPAC